MEFLQENWLAIWTLGFLMFVFCAFGYVYIQNIISGLVRKYFREDDIDVSKHFEIQNGIDRLTSYEWKLKYFAIGGIVIQLLMIIIR